MFGLMVLEGFWGESLYFYIYLRLFF